MIARILLALLLAVGVASAQEEGPPPADQPVEAVAPPVPDLDQPVPQDKMLIARGMMQAGVMRMADVAAKQYDLTPAQAEQAKQIVFNFWSSLPPEDVDALVRGFYYGRQLVQSGQARPEQFQRLAAEVLPVAERVFEKLDASSAKFEALLTDEQLGRYRDDQEKQRQGREHFFNRTRQVASGELKLGPNGEPEGGWRSLGEQDRQMQVSEEEVVEVLPDGSERRIVVKRITSKLPVREAVATNEKYWPAFVKGYIAKYDLDAGQEKKARRALGEALAAARAHRDKHREEFNDAARRRAKAETDQNLLLLEQVQKVEAPLLAPIIAQFNQLEKKLDELPGDAQRKAAEHRGDLFGRPQSDSKDGN